MDGTAVFQIGAAIVTSCVVPPAAYAIKKLFGKIDDSAAKLDEVADDMIIVKTVLMGPEGENGLRSDVKANQTAIAAIHSRLDRAQIAL